MRPSAPMRTTTVKRSERIGPPAKGVPAANRMSLQRTVATPVGSTNNRACRKAREPQKHPAGARRGGCDGRRPPLIGIPHGPAQERPRARRRPLSARVQHIELVQLVCIRQVRDHDPAKRRAHRRHGGDFDEAGLLWSGRRAGRGPWPAIDPRGRLRIARRREPRPEQRGASISA